MAVTIKDLSAYLGLSPSAVSKALNGYTDISQETRNRVFAAAVKLGYRPSAIARGLKTGRTFNIGIVYSENSGSGFTHSYFSPVLESLKAEAEIQGYDITFISSSMRASGQKAMTYLQHSQYRNVDGVCIVCCEFNDPQIIELVNSGIPVVTIDRPFEGKACVASENVQGMKALVNYIISMGHKKIAMIYGSPSNITTIRLNCFIDTMKENGIPLLEGYLVESLYHNPGAVKEAVAKLLSLPSPPSCIVLPDDFASLGAIELIEERKLKIPEDISIAGFDGVPILQMLHPRITTVLQDTFTIGREAAKLLINQIEDSENFIPRTVEVATKLIKGETVANNRR